MNVIESRLSSTCVPVSPAIDEAQALWAMRELEGIIDQLGSDSPVAMVLRHARREIVSLTTASNTGTVVGPFRVAA